MFEYAEALTSGNVDGPIVHTQPDTPMMADVHWCEQHYGSIAATPDNDPHLLAARRLALGSSDRLPTKHKKMQAVDDSQIVDLYKRGYDANGIAEKLGIAASTAARHITMYRRSIGEQIKGETYDHAAILKEYQRTQSLDETAERFGCSTSLVKNIELEARKAEK